MSGPQQAGVSGRVSRCVSHAPCGSWSFPSASQMTTAPPTVAERVDHRPVASAQRQLLTRERDCPPRPMRPHLQTQGATHATRRKMAHWYAYQCAMLARMSAIKARARRADNAPTVLLQGRVSPDTRAEVQAAAAESGVSIAYYLDALIMQLVEERGSLPVVDRPRPQREELPIPAA